MDELIQEIEEMLTCFTPVEDVCIATRMSKEELDKFSKKHFDMPLEEAAEVFAAKGRARVHAAQVAAACEGNNSMLLLLGKQYLGQTDEAIAPTPKKESNPFEQIVNKYANAKDKKRTKSRKSNTTN